MFKKLLCVAIMALTGLHAVAQRQNVYFYKNNGRQVTQRDSADYTRVVREPDSGSVYYKVMEYYLNGKPKRMAFSSTISPLKLEGACTTFNTNGLPQSELNYDKGFLVGQQRHYYANGKLAEVRIYPKLPAKGESLVNRAYTIDTFNDSTGTSLVVNGKGKYKSVTGGRKPIVAEGSIDNGLKEGEWRTSINRDSLTLTETWHEGKLLSGTGKLATGETYTYTVADKLPEFNGGTKDFNKYLSTTLRYPAEAQTRRIEGRVMVSFVVEKDGMLSDIKVTDKNASPILAAEAVRVLEQSPKWIPGIRYGHPDRVNYTVPIVFQLNR